MTCTGAEEDKEETVEQSDQAQQESSQVRELWDGLDTLGIRLREALQMPEIWELRLLKYFFILCVAITFYVGTSLPCSATQWLHIETVKQGLTVKHLHIMLC